MNVVVEEAEAPNQSTTNASTTTSSIPPTTSNSNRSTTTTTPIPRTSFASVRQQSQIILSLTTGDASECGYDDDDDDDSNSKDDDDDDDAFLAAMKEQAAFPQAVMEGRRNNNDNDDDAAAALEKEQAGGQQRQTATADENSVAANSDSKVDNNNNINKDDSYCLTMIKDEPGAFRAVSGKPTQRASETLDTAAAPFVQYNNDNTNNNYDSVPIPQTEKEATTPTTLPEVVCAVRVEADDDVEERVRQRILNEAVQADRVVVVCSTTVEESSAAYNVSSGNNNHSSKKQKQADDDSNSSSSSKKSLFIVLFLILLGGLVIGLGVGLSKNNKTEVPLSLRNDTSPAGENDNEDLIDNSIPPDVPSGDDEGENLDTPSSGEEIMLNNNLSTLEAVQQRGVVRCGVYDDMLGFAFKTSDDTMEGFNIEMCRAVAAAALGDPDKVEYVSVTAANRFVTLASKVIDMISQTVTITMERDLYDPTSQQGLTFSYPYYFSGLVFGGHKEFVECADRLDPFSGICRQLKVCVVIGTIQEAALQTLLPGSAVVKFESPRDAIVFMNDGTCNVIAGEAITLNPGRLAMLGLFQNINFTLGENTFTRDPLALVTRDDDTEWSNMVNSVVKILYSAEALNLTMDNVESRMQEEYADQLDEEFVSRVVNIVSKFGNYEELYTSQVGSVVERQRANQLRTAEADSGLIYSYPFGTVTLDEIPNISSEVMANIQERGVVNCGIPLDGGDDHPSLFAAYDESTDTYSGLDVEYCRALAAGLFVGDSNLVNFTVLTEFDAFQALSAGHVDVLAGQELTLANEFFEPTTGKSFSFSEPYFRDTTDGTTRALATRRDDDVWSSFVYWTLTAIVFADEMGITSASAILIPPVSFFGESLLQCFRDSVASVGNYGEIYNRTIGSTIERSGANLVNTVPYGPQQVGYPLL